MPSWLAAGAGGGIDSTLIGSILQSAGAGTAIIVVLILLGFIAPKSYTDRVEQEADRWHVAYETSRTEAEELRRTLAVQTERADTAVATAQRNAEILERLQARTADVVETPQTRPHRRG